MQIRARAILAILFLLPGLPLHAGPASRGAEAVVIYNKRMPESKRIALHYAEQRGVPEKQIFAFDLPKTEAMTRAEFEKDLQAPLLRALEKASLIKFGKSPVAGTNHTAAEQWVTTEAGFRYAVLCYGVPVRIAPDPDRKEDGATNLVSSLRRNEAAVDNELAVLPFARQKLLLAGPLRNPLYSVTNAAWLHPTNGILMVARLDGPTPEIALALVDKALAAERDGLWGRTYFDVRSLEKTNSYYQGDAWIRAAAEVCRIYGYDVELDERPGTFPAGYPLSQVAIYAGWYDEHVSGPFTRTNVEFMPGAIAYHLHSWSAGEVRTTREHWVGPLLAKGATATMGCVFEPYLEGTPDIHAFFGRLLFFGFTFGEAAYACQTTLSWQTTVIGDPLYRPFGRAAPELHQDLENRHSPLLAWSHERIVNLNIVRKTPFAEVENYLQKLELTRQSPVLTEKLADVYEKIGKPYSAAQSRMKALELNPTPQQEVRLALSVIGQLLEQHREADALKVYQQLLHDQPDHPDRLAFLETALVLARKEDAKDLMTAYEQEITRLKNPTKPN